MENILNLGTNKQTKKVLPYSKLQEIRIIELHGHIEMKSYSDCSENIKTVVTGAKTRGH